MINLRKFSSILQVNPNDAYDLDLVLGKCPDDDRHRALKPKADHLRNSGYEPDESAEMLRAWLTRPEKYSGEVSDTVERSWAEWQELVIVGGKSIPNIKPDCQEVVKLYKKYGGLLALNTYMFKWMRMDMTTKEWLSKMYQPSDLLCLGRHMEEIKVLSLDTILHQFPSQLVPDPDSQAWQYWEETKRGIYRTDQFCVMTPATYQMEWMYDKGRNWGRYDLNILRRKYWCIEMDISEKQKKGIGRASSLTAIITASICRRGSSYTFLNWAFSSSLSCTAGVSPSTSGVRARG